MTTDTKRPDVVPVVPLANRPKAPGAESRFKVKEHITVPFLHHEPGKTIYIKFVSEAVRAEDRIGSQGELQRGLDIVDVINLEDGRHMRYILDPPTLKALRLIKGVYFGRCFKIEKEPPPKGKRVKTVQIWEIEDPGDGKGTE